MTPLVPFRAPRVPRARALTALFAVLVLLVATALGACHRAESDTRGEAVDLPLMAYLSQARARHHEANLREAENDIAGALLALDRLVSAPKPGGERPEVGELLADTRARMAELRTRSGDLVGAERDIQAGLVLAPGRTYFRGHLLEVAGILEEARASNMTDAGKSDEAAAARAKALDLLRQAVAIQEEVIRTTLGDGGAPQ